MRLCIWIYRYALMICISFVLSACSGSLFLDQNAADYSDTRARTADSQLLLNILRARDDAPIHFSDLSIIRSSVQISGGSNSSLPLGIPFVGLPRPMLSPSLNLQTTPSFDLGTLDTQDFTKGLLTPIDPKVIKTFFDQGVDYRIILLLFFSSIEVDSVTFPNNLSCDIGRSTNTSKEDCYYQIYNYLREIGRFGKITGHIYSALTPIGPPFVIDAGKQLKDLSGLDEEKYRVRPNFSGQYRLYRVQQRIALCRLTDGKKLSLSRKDYRACNDNEVIVESANSQAGNSLYVRSVYEVIKYLGQVLKFQDLKSDREPNRCLTLDQSDRLCGGDVLFQVNGPVGDPVVSVAYGGTVSSVARSPCRSQGPCDHSLETLALLTLLLNANKAAKDIPSTPAVQLIQ